MRTVWLNGPRPGGGGGGAGCEVEVGWAAEGAPLHYWQCSVPALLLQSAGIAPELC